MTRTLCMGPMNVPQTPFQTSDSPRAWVALPSPQLPGSDAHMGPSRWLLNRTSLPGGLNFPGQWCGASSPSSPHSVVAPAGPRRLQRGRQQMETPDPAGAGAGGTGRTGRRAPAPSVALSLRCGRQRFPWVFPDTEARAFEPGSTLGSLPRRGWTVKDKVCEVKTKGEAQQHESGPCSPIFLPAEVALWKCHLPTHTPASDSTYTCLSPLHLLSGETASKAAGTLVPSPTTL